MLTSLFYGAELMGLTVGLGSVIVGVLIVLVEVILIIRDIKKQTTHK